MFIYFNIQIIIFSEYATKMQKKAVLYYIYTKPTIIPSILWSEDCDWVCCGIEKVMCSEI